MKKIVIIAVAGIVLVGGSIGATVAILGGDEPAEAGTAESADGTAEGGGVEMSGTPIYHEFHPNFVVNINDGRKTRFLQVDVAAVVFKQSHVDDLKDHMPALRNDLILLLSSQEAAPLRTQEGKENLRAQAREVVRNVMQAKEGKPLVEDIYFNKFVIQ